MNISLDNKQALIGASTQGLGKAIAIQLAQCGATVTLLARNESKLTGVLTELSTELGQKHNYLVADFSDFEKFSEIISSFFKSNFTIILIYFFIFE